MNTADDDALSVTVEDIVGDHGSVVVFAGTTEDGAWVTFGVSHREAEALALAVLTDEYPEAVVPVWAVLSREAL